MPYQLRLPKFGMAMQAAKIVEWKKDEGDFIEKEETVLVVENEKLTNEIKTMEAGVLLRKVALIGESYPVGDLLAYLGEEGEALGEAPLSVGVSAESGGSVSGASGSVSDGTAAASVSPLALTPAPSGPVNRDAGAGAGRKAAASPLAKKLAAQLGVDINDVPGRGPGGRVEKADVQDYADSLIDSPAPSETVTMPGTAPGVAEAAGVAGAAEAGRTAAANVAGASDRTGGGAEAVGAVGGPEYTELPYSGMRRAVGVNMQNAWTTVPMVTHHVRTDAGALQDIRKALNAGVEDKGEKVTINDILLKLTAAALRKAPAVNSSLQGDWIRVYRRVNLGMATALEDGLIVPVIRDADKKSLLQISREAKDLSARARGGKLLPDDVRDGTFTVTNLGGYGSVDEFTPIINPPQAAILGVGRIIETPAVFGGEICARPQITLSFTYDHRVVDGAVAADFIRVLMDLIANPLRAICE